MARTRSRKRSPSLEDELAELDPASDDPFSEDARARIVRGLGSTRSFVVKRAAELVKEHGIEGTERELEAAFARMLVDPVASDPGCHGKLAVLEALDYLEASAEETFLLGARHVQLEAAWGPPVDTAAGVRARGLVALARIAHPDLPLLAGEMLADLLAPVRQAAADALAGFGARASAGALLLKLRQGDDDPLVTLAVMSALLGLAPEWALPLLEAQLATTDDEAREVAAMALGQSRRDDALEVLIAALERAVRSSERATLYRALGLHRSDRALELLLGVIAEGRAADARAAIHALAVRRFEPGVRERAREAAKRNTEVDLGADLDDAFRDRAS